MHAGLKSNLVVFLNMPICKEEFFAIVVLAFEHIQLESFRRAS